MMNRFFKFLGSFIKPAFMSRYGLLFSAVTVYLVLSFLVRLVLTIISSDELSGNIITNLAVFIAGFIFDVSVALFFIAFYSFYLLLIPVRLIGTMVDKIITCFILSIVLLLIFFSAMAEFPFWDEFGSRFNFIAVDYLIYTYEVIENINESYPLPLLVTVLLAMVIFVFYLLWKTGVFEAAFSDKLSFRKRIVCSGSILLMAISCGILLSNKNAEFSGNRTVNELSKNGVFSFFAAFRSNELDYQTFYTTLPHKQTYSLLRKNLLQPNQKYQSADLENIARITVPGNEKQGRPNIFLITVESLSADFLKAFGNKEDLTPNYDRLAKESIFFTNLYATGTRTVRGMEALILSVPPTPGNSIVRRPDNQNLISVASILKAKNYQLDFIYGGDGYFDNMNTFFGGQGFDIVDRDRGNPIPESVNTNRFPISDNEVTFENAWGICDEDIYNQSLKFADNAADKKSPFFQFVMTTSNHKPYTFPDGKIDMKQGSRESAVKYTDYALGKFLKEARKRSWFKNSVFVIVADHCASSAGKWEINISKHHIPAIIYNMNQRDKIDRLTSQIDVMPTLFGYFGWQYRTALYGKDINKTKPGDERAFIGNYRTLGILKQNIFTQLNDHKQVHQFNWQKENDNMKETKPGKYPDLVNETISYYQSSSERFKSGKMKELNNQ